MNNRLIYISIFIFFTTLSYGQLSFTGWSEHYLGISTYNGATQNEAHTLRFNYSGTNLNEQNWRLGVKVQTPFKSGNVAFPVNKIRLIPKRTNGQENFPTVQQVGMTTASLTNNTEVFIVPSSNTALYYVSEYNGYYFFEMIYDMIIEGGGYLQNLQNNSFEGMLRFTAYRENNSIIGFQDINFRIQVHTLSGTPPIENQYSISFTNEASNAMIEYSSLADYVNGKSVTYKDGLTVSATTDYQVSVRSINDEFTTDTGDKIDLDVVKLQLAGSSANGPLTALSNNKKTVVQGLNTSGQSTKFDITYSTDPNDLRLYNVSSKNYSTQLMFEITPQ